MHALCDDTKSHTPPVFLEAPESLDEMKAFCDAAPNTPKLANMLEGGFTPILPPKELEAMGFKIAAYPLTLMSTAVNSMNRLLLCYVVFPRVLLRVIGVVVCASWPILICHLSFLSDDSHVCSSIEDSIRSRPDSSPRVEETMMPVGDFW